ncbi:uncharacterized protein LOC133533789 isoform X2 [Cydia pomonella]|uniref:uncharacterized protein LOC133533789 isoform X2 n=1 Tax=Cydia pomonella TaxID=82600 RepID=UPI002ADE29A4|nr:uncharacterized protein LOC133533789 isoform X2 [Cydia pomonella]
MSPLARSLLALGALLAAADSQYNCDNEEGYITKDSYNFTTPFYVPYGVDGEVHIPDVCFAIFRRALMHIGEKVQACNIERGHPPPRIIPVVWPIGPLEPVRIEYCKDPNGCMVYITEYCDLPYPPPPVYNQFSG